MRKKIFYSLVRRKINIYILLLLTFLTVLIYTGIVVYQASEQNIREIEQSYGSSFTINSLKDENNADFWKEVPVGEDMIRVYVGPRVNEELLARVSKEVEGIMAYEMQLTTRVFQEDWNCITGYWGNRLTMIEQEMAEGTIEDETALKQEMEFGRGWMVDFSVYSALNSENHEAFYDGTFELVEGRHIVREDEGVILISRELAEINRFQVGDKVILHSDFIDKNGCALKGNWEKEAVILGLFDTTYTQAISEYTHESDIMINWIIMDMNTMTELRTATGLPIEASTATLIVEDASATESVLEQVKQLDWIDWNYYYLERDDSLYQDAIKPLKTVKMIMGAGLGLAVAAGVALLYLVLAHNIGQREREAGILLALGIKAKEIRRQFFVENFILGIAAYLLAAGIAVGVAPVAGDKLLGAFRTVWNPKTYIEEEFAIALQQGNSQLVQTITQGQRDGIPTPDTLQVQVEVKYLLLVVLLECGIIFICTYGALGKTLKWEPAKVLSMVR